jgi:hypothetical protein
MAATTKSKAAERFANLQKRDQDVRRDIEVADRIRTEKMARLRELRLAKEEADRAARSKEAAVKAEKQTLKKARPRSAQNEAVAEN